MKIGTHIPLWRVPILQDGTLSFSSLTSFEGEYFVLCCIQSLTVTQTRLLKSQSDDFLNTHARLIALLNHDRNHEFPWPPPEFSLRLPLLTDPLQRLSRPLGLSQHLSIERCETLIFNQDSRLEFRLIHDFNQSGFTRVLEMTKQLIEQNHHTNLLQDALVGSGT
ncbi:MAG: hypothetical protein MRJ96_02675 [Nitrospirales bacterium]|nr:hypothetical protein [Nitrospira sp.]MDR4500346.1 hypothetical protein [Nitrospirales bacterium]